MKKLLSAMLAMIIVSALIVGCTSGENSDVKVLKLGHVWPNSEIHAQATEEFAKEVEELSNGTLKIEIFGDGTLGDDKDLLEGMKVGTTDIWVGGSGVLSSSSETANILTIPFMFRDQEHFNKVYDGEVGQEITEKIQEESGYKVLSYWDRGARWLTTNKPINEPEDLKGLKIRVPDSPVFVNSWKTIGAAPTPMEFGEVFTSIQQGVIDGQENPLSLIYNSKFNEVVDYLVKTEHVREPISMVISEDTFESLSPEHQDVLTQAANGKGKQFASDEVEKGDTEYLEELTKNGMELIEPNIPAFQEKLDGFVDKEFPMINEIYNKILSVE